MHLRLYKGRENRRGNKGIKEPKAKWYYPEIRIC